jgi:hypothetical protein
MRSTFLLLLCCAFQCCIAQKINYDIPEGVEKNITREDYKKIVDMAVPLVSARYTVETVNDGAIQVKEGQTFNLHNLINRCAAIKNRSAWDLEINSHFTKLFASIDAKEKINPEDYETIKDLLALRIYPDASIASYGGLENLVSKVDLQETHTVLMFDFPGAFTPVQKELIEKWKKDSAEIFQTAQTNMNKQKVEKMTEEFKVNNNKYPFTFVLEENYASSYVLDLKNNSPDLVGEWGSVIVVPNKSMAGICKIGKNNPVDFVKFIELIDPFIQKQFAEHPQPILPDYFWYYKGKFTKINITVKDGKMSIVAPMGLAELMAGVK